jgi:hypothetical protein
MPSVEFEIAYLQAGVPLLESYLLSNDLYRSIGSPAPGGQSAFPQLTIGSLLLSQARLNARRLDERQRSGLAAIDQELYACQYRWRTAWDRKSAQEFSARLKLWGDFLGEYRLSPENHSDRYAYEVRRRVMLELLTPFVQNQRPAEMELLSGLDTLLTSVLVAGKFIWEPDIAEGFPPERYWYLYGSMRG